MKDWLKYRKNIFGDGAVESGGIPKTRKEIGDGKFVGANAIKGDDFYFVDFHSEQLRRCNLVSGGDVASICIADILEYTHEMILGDGLIFTGFHLFRERDLSLLWSLMDDSAGQLEKFGVDASKRLGKIADVGYGDGKFYRVFNEDCPELGLLEIDSENFFVNRIPVPASSFVFLNDGSIVTQFDNSVARYQRDGTLIWGFEFEFTDDYKLRHRVSFSVLGDKVLCYSTEGEIVCLDRLEGTVIWHSSAEAAISWDYSKNHTAIASCVSNGKVAVFKVTGNTKLIFAVSVDDGALLWIDKEDSFTQKIGHCIAGDLLFTAVSSEETYPFALDCYTGEKVWSDESHVVDYVVAIAADKRVFYRNTYFQGHVFEWDEPYNSPHWP